MATAANSERRADGRRKLVRPIKVRCGITGRLLDGQTINVSAGGALLEIRHPVRLAWGQPVSVAIAWTGQDVVMKSVDLLAGRVVRNLGVAGVQRVAVEFEKAQELAATA